MRANECEPARTAGQRAEVSVVARREAISGCRGSRTTLRWRARAERRGECRAAPAQAGGARSSARRRRGVPDGSKRRYSPGLARPRPLRATRRPPRPDHRPPARLVPKAACASLRRRRGSEAAGADDRAPPGRRDARPFAASLSVTWCASPRRVNAGSALPPRPALACRRRAERRQKRNARIPPKG